MLIDDELGDGRSGGWVQWARVLGSRRRRRERFELRGELGRSDIGFGDRRLDGRGQRVGVDGCRIERSRRLGHWSEQRDGFERGLGKRDLWNGQLGQGGLGNIKLGNGRLGKCQLGYRQLGHGRHCGWRRSVLHLFGLRPS